jgi:outer membrane lipoprotein-sorting protein
MKIKITSSIGGLLLALILSSYIDHQNSFSPEEILLKAEKKRSPWSQMSMLAELNTIINSKEKQSIYKVYFKNSENTLVAFKEPKFEKGNILLMVGEDLWYYVRDTKRPTRITPVQKLSGSVSYGDLARLGWSKDYTIDSHEETKLNNTDTYILNLHAKSQGATYQKIKLWIDKNTFKPTKAEVFLLSGKLYKSLKFTKYQIIAGEEVNTQIEFIDHFNKDQKSVLDFTQITQEKNIPNRYFIKTSLAAVSDEVCQ